MDTIIEIFSWISKIVTTGIGIGSIVWVIAKLFGKNLIELWFQKRLKTYETDLDLKVRSIQNSLDIQLEKARVQFGRLNTERIEVYKEICKRLNHIDDLINKISSFDSYECKLNVDYDSKCTEHDCDSACIVNYWTYVTEFDKYVRDTKNYIDCNEIFMTLQQELSLHKIFNILLSLLKEAIHIGTRPEKSSKDKALEIFSLFRNVDKVKLDKEKQTLIDLFRAVIGISQIEDLQNEKIRTL